MFITFTIDTRQKKSKKIRMHKKKFNASSGWRKTVISKKRSFWQKIKAWKRSLGAKQYRLGEQTIIF